jgi:hypothetical protein
LNRLKQRKKLKKTLQRNCFIFSQILTDFGVTAKLVRQISRQVLEQVFGLYPTCLIERHQKLDNRIADGSFLFLSSFFSCGGVLIFSCGGELLFSNLIILWGTTGGILMAARILEGSWSLTIATFGL